MSDDPPALFDAAPRVVAAPPSPERVALGARLPEGVRLGTSSWSFPGWAGEVWGARYAPQDLARHGLAAYAQHPLFRSVGVDRSYYQPLSTDAWRTYAEQVPDGFRFLVKAPSMVVRPRTEARQDNPHFLDPAWATEHAIRPVHEGLGSKAGPLVFQFSRLPADLGSQPDRFAERLHAFLDALPGDVPLAVEVRDRQLLVPRYAEALADTGVSHCLNVFPGMPTVATQARVAAAARSPLTVVRWMLRPDRSYAEAKAAFAPFDRLAAPHPEAREDIAAVVASAVAAGRPAWVIANNKAEGSAPRSLGRLAIAVVAAIRSSS